MSMRRTKRDDDAEAKRLEEFDRATEVVERSESGEGVPELLDLLRAHLALHAQLAGFEGRIRTDRDRASRDTVHGWVARSAAALRAQLSGGPRPAAESRVLRTYEEALAGRAKLLGAMNLATSRSAYRRRCEESDAQDREADRRGRGS